MSGSMRLASTTGYTATPVRTGESGGRVMRLAAPRRPTRFLKTGRGRVADALVHELVRLEWFAGRVPVPRVEEFVRTRQDATLVTTALPGVSAHAALVANPTKRRAIVRALARFLRTLHALPVDECPFDASAPVRLADAARNVRAGRVDTGDFDDDHAGWSARRVLAKARALRPRSPGRVVTHGDFSLDNVFVHRGRVTGCLDVGRAGVADPYQDLAILWHNLAEFGEEMQAESLRAYGIRTPDMRRLRFHLVLDELF